MHELKLREGFEFDYGFLNKNLFEFAKNTMIYNIFKKKYFSEPGEDAKRKDNLKLVESNLRNLLK